MAARTGSTPTPPLLTEPGRSSPPPACAICLGQFKNKSFTETCLHQFCFNCLLEWSKIKAECPLCKQPFTTILHSVRSNDVYDKYVIQQPLPPNDLEFTSEIMYSRRFRYRTTLTLHTRESIAIQRLLDSLPTDSSLNSNHTIPSSNTPSFRNHITHSIMFRRRIYNQNMWAHSLPDITGRFRDCSPEIYRNTPAELNRLVPWITRELSALVNSTSISYALNEILTKLTQHAIRSRAFHEFISTYIPYYTDQFIHELYQFARTPFDMRGYDQFVSYGVGNPVVVDNYVNEISSSEENNSTDSDVLVIATDAGPSNSTNNSNNALSEPSTSAWNSSRSLGCPVVIESIRQSDTDESSDEVILVMCKKPPHERTPEIVDLVASDSDAVIIEEPRSSSVTCINTQSDHSSPSAPSTSGVRSALKRKRSFTLFSSDSDSDCFQPSVNKNSVLRNTLLRKYTPKSRNTAGTDDDTDSDSSSTMSSSSSSSSSTNLKKTFTGESKNNELSQSKKNHDNKIINAIFSKIARSQSASSNSQGPSSIKKHKHKKSKHKKRTKRNHKHKVKSKKRSKSNDKSTEKLYKGKFCNKSKMKNRQMGDSPNETFSSLPYWPAPDSDSSSSAQENDSKRKTLKSVVTTVPSTESENKTSLLDLMSIAVLSSNSVLSIKNKDNQETVRSKESSCPIPDNDSSERLDLN